MPRRDQLHILLDQRQWWIETIFANAKKNSQTKNVLTHLGNKKAKIPDFFDKKGGERKLFLEKITPISKLSKKVDA